jgi:opacity protein-like surface antigen
MAPICKFVLVCLAVLTFAQGARAQALFNGNVFIGYSFYATSHLSSSQPRLTLNGWNASLEGKVLPWLGIVADFDSHYGSQGGACVVVIPIGGECRIVGNASARSILFGPRLSMSVGKVRPFAEALFGAGHISTDGVGSDTSFSTAVGGGLDYKIIRPIALRLQGDYVQTRLFGTTQNNLRISTGIVVRF